MVERVLCWCRKVYVDPAIVTTSVAGEMTCSPECHHHALEQAAKLAATSGWKGGEQATVPFVHH